MPDGRYERWCTGCRVLGRHEEWDLCFCDTTRCWVLYGLNGSQRVWKPDASWAKFEDLPPYQQEAFEVLKALLNVPAEDW